MSNFKKKVILLILDGWGIAEPDKFNAILNAATPNIDRLSREYPNTQLKTDGLAVGLPEGSPGTSEVNHMTIGAGRVIFQDLPKINNAITDRSFHNNEQLLGAINHVKKHNSKLHLLGITSFGGVHSHLDHVMALLDMCKEQGLKDEVFIHAFTDGRDTPPQNALEDLSILQSKMDRIGVGTFATLQGRVWLDRDRDWDKTDTALSLLTEGKGISVDAWQQAVKYGYNTYDTCEYFDQYIINNNGLIAENDAVIFFHYRSDRMYQLLKRFIDKDINNLYLTSFIEASEDFHMPIAFPREEIHGTLAEVISKAGGKQLHITETEKYPHLTYFLNGMSETELDGETWQLIESNRLVKPNYNLEPGMKIFEITQVITDAIQADKYDFMAINLASGDMVGHTGHYGAAVISAEGIDTCIGRIYEALEPKLEEYVLIITADHGNSEEMWDYENDQPHTRHTLNKVPLILISDLKVRLKNQKGLDTLAPTILELMGLKSAPEMRGENLIQGE